MLIDEFMPRWDARERHQIAVRATPAQVYAALRSANLGGHPLVRTLFAARSLPLLLSDPPFWRKRRAEGAGSLSLAAFEALGFRVLAEDPPVELVIGVEGAFWRPGGVLRPVDPAAFRQPVPAGVARAAWSFHVAPGPPGRCTLHTETRILTADARARRRFRLYWALVRPGSGLIRRVMLRAIRRKAETAR